MIEHETQTIDMLFLELAQFTKARTWKELDLEKERDELRELAGNLLKAVEYYCIDQELIDHAKKVLKK